MPVADVIVRSMKQPTFIPGDAAEGGMQVCIKCRRSAGRNPGTSFALT